MYRTRWSIDMVPTHFMDLGGGIDIRDLAGIMIPFIL